MAQSAAERRAAQRVLREQIRTGTYKRSEIGRASARARHRALEDAALQNLKNQLGHRDGFNEDKLTKRIRDRDPNSPDYIPPDDLNKMADMSEDELVEKAKQPVPEGKRSNPYWYH